jgi:hypothetical protein
VEDKEENTKTAMAIAFEEALRKARQQKTPKPQKPPKQV